MVNATVERKEVMNVFRKGKSELFALTEVKLKGIIVWSK